MVRVLFRHVSGAERVVVFGPGGSFSLDETSPWRVISVTIK
jgi:hypothetical protein